MKPAILDCTLRDGGLVNDFYFSDEFVSDLYRTNLRTGVDYMEFGYKASEKEFDRNQFGKWKFCREEDIRAIVGDNPTSMKISVMADIGRTDKGDIPDKKDSVVDMIRIATYSSTMAEAVDMVEYCHNKGYETTVNIMAISNNTEKEMEEFLTILADSPVDVIYLVDSFGAFYPEQVRRLTKLYRSFVKRTGKEIGIHAHNNQQLAFANTIESFGQDTKFLDVTMGGLGRGAGNCSMEMLFGYLSGSDRGYNELPVLEFIEKHVMPLKEEGYRWGYELPYLLTGQKQVHPSAAINFIKECRTELAQMYAEIC